MCYDLHEGGWACHERLAIRVRIYVPMSVDTYVLDADDLAVFRAQTSAATVTDDTSLLSVRLPCRPPQARTAAVTHLPSAPSAHPVPVWRARANTKTRDYRTFESAHRAQTTCAPARQQARKQAPQSVAQWLLPFSHTVPPRSSCLGLMCALV